MDGKSFAIVQGDCLKIRWSNGQYCGFIINVCSKIAMLGLPKTF